MTYFNVKVQFTVEDSKGKIKKQNVNYLVDSQSCMDAKTKITEFLIKEGDTGFEVKSISESKIVGVL